MAFIYALCCPESGDIRYIGKANNVQARFKSHLRDANRRVTPVYCWIKSLAKRGLRPALRVLMETADWIADERRLIAQYRQDGARLLNVADGGDEPQCSKEVRVRNGKANAMSVHGDPLKRRIWELKQALGDALKRGHLNESHKAKMRLAAQKRPDLFGHWAAI